MANANVASRMQQVSVLLYKITALPKGCECRTHYSWTLKQADRNGAIRLDDEGMVTDILEKNLKFDLPAGMQLEDIMATDLLKEILSSRAPESNTAFMATVKSRSVSEVPAPAVSDSTPETI